ncbi:MAG: DegT/DnrJ/EryC1/StrS family aminotransferase [Candidatus Omnitrophota bacterium]|nr:DegT/DnrJ/EryC1/StrS family aminotransferase [Candidatus Omnitrophota bacterium]
MIPVNEPLMGKKELQYITDCVKSGWISSKGKYIKSFEEEFAKFCGVRYGISTTNGTAALHLALACLGIKKGDEVIMPTFTMIATAYAVLYLGAKPVFIDSEDRTWNMDVSDIEEAVNSKTRVLLPVHIYGHPVNMDPIIKLSKKYGIFIVEDAAEAHGARYKNKLCGSMGDINSFSFYANKIITTGEGGMVVTNNRKLAERARLLKDLSHSPGQRFLHTELAYNYRMTNMQAAIGLAQIENANSLIARKRRIAGLYYENLKDVEGLRLPLEEKWAKSVYWMYSVLVEEDFGLTRDRFRTELLKEGIETRSFFIPMHRQPVIQKLGLVDKKKRYPVSDYISDHGLYLPTGLALKDKNILFICEAIRKIQRRHASRTR